MRKCIFTIFFGMVMFFNSNCMAAQQIIEGTYIGKDPRTIEDIKGTQDYSVHKRDNPSKKFDFSFLKDPYIATIKKNGNDYFFSIDGKNDRVEKIKCNRKNNQLLCFNEYVEDPESPFVVTQVNDKQIEITIPTSFEMAFSGSGHNFFVPKIYTRK